MSAYPASHRSSSSHEETVQGFKRLEQELSEDDAQGFSIEEVAMNYAAANGRMSEAVRSRITAGALAEISTLEEFAKNRARQRNRFIVPITAALSVSLSVGMFFILQSVHAPTEPLAVVEQVSTSTATDSINNELKQVRYSYNVVSDPATRRYPLSGKSYANGLQAQAFWNEITNVMFVDVSMLPVLSNEEVYTAWAVTEHGPALVGTIQTDGATSLARVGCEPVVSKVVITKALKANSHQYRAADVVFEGASNAR